MTQTENGTAQARPVPGSAPCSPPSMMLHAACGGGLWAIIGRGCARRPAGLQVGAEKRPPAEQRNGSEA